MVNNMDGTAVFNVVEIQQHTILYIFSCMLLGVAVDCRLTDGIHPYMWSSLIFLGWGTAAKYRNPDEDDADDDEYVC